MRNSDNYTAWSIKEKDFPTNGAIGEQIAFLIGYGILAPSTFNTQPWVFEVKGANLYIKHDTDLHLRGGDPTGRNMVISLGTCTFNIRVAAAYFGLSSKVTYAGTSVEDLCINLEFSKTAKPDEVLASLFPQIVRRYSEKRTIQGTSLSNEVLKKLRQSSVDKTTIYFVNSQPKVAQLAQLTYQAAAGFSSNPEFARELSSWMRSNNTLAHDGMPGFSSGVSTPKVLLAKAILKRTPKVLKPMAKKYLQMVQTSPAVGVITTPTDTWEDWVRTGMTYERLALTASAQGISLSPMSVLIEGPARDRLTDYFDGMSGHPQMFYRLIKTSGQALHTPRRVSSK